MASGSKRHAAAALVTKVQLDQLAGSRVPGLQYVVVGPQETLFEYASGLADVGRRVPMTLEATMMAYSMTKTITAVAVLQLVERGRLSLDQAAASWLPAFPYGDRVTIRHMLCHTSGIPNPIPLRWAHLAEEDARFDEDEALAQVLARNPKLAFEPGQRYLYSNIGYWLLGKIVEKASGQPYRDYVRARVLQPLNISSKSMGFAIPRPAFHAGGYLGRHSAMNLLKNLVMDSRLWIGYEGKWLRFASHHLDGPAFGGLVGTARGFGIFLQDQLRPESVLFGHETARLLRTQQTDDAGRPVAMTPGWHVAVKQGVTVLFKEGGGGGFHSEMRVYPAQQIATVIMVNGTQFDSTRTLDRIDGAFFPA